MDSPTEINKIKDCLSQMNFSSYGFTELKKPVTIEAYKNWLNQGFHGDMEYLENHLTFKEFPQTLVNQARSAIVVTKNYFPTSKPHDQPFSGLRMAEYARNNDYHHWLLDELNDLIQKLKVHFPTETFIAMTDSKPVLERDLAHRAGLGWFGKNTCLIHSQQGSLFFIGEIYTSLLLNKEPKALHPDRCGTCTKCIDACPTQALVDPYVLNANRCISYLTIEKKGSLAPDLLPAMNDWFFGCDICQSVCPWNEKVFGPPIKKEQIEKKKISPELVTELRWVLTTSGKKLLRALQKTPLVRTRAAGLKRNALIVIANQGLTELLPEVIECQKQESINEIANWCEQQLKSSK